MELFVLYFWKVFRQVALNYDAVCKHKLNYINLLMMDVVNLFYR